MHVLLKIVFFHCHVSFQWCKWSRNMKEEKVTNAACDETAQKGVTIHVPWAMGVF